MEKIVYNFQNASSFILNDKTLLSKHFHLLEIKPGSKLKILTPFFIFYQLIIIVIYWNNFRLIISQIAGYHTYIPSLLSKLNLKKHVIILHGTECNTIPEINYGNLSKPLLGWFTRQSIINATLLLPVSESLISDKSRYYNIDNATFGLFNNIPNIKTPYKIIYNGINISEFNIINFSRPKNTFITVALGIETKRNYFLKGIDLILQIARENPELKFTIVGSKNIYNYNNELDNVLVVGKVNQNTLIDYYNLNNYYLQLSISESFGLSLCEAMLCGCLPIVSDTGIMPKIIQDMGLVLMHRNLYELKSLISNAQEVNNDKHLMVTRRKLIYQFSLEAREQKLLDAISTLLK